MTQPPLYIAALLAGLLFYGTQAFSQQEVSVKTTISRRQILIGEPIQLTLEVKAPAGAALSWFPEDSLPHFEWVRKGKIDSVTQDGEKSYRQDILVTSFDSGTWVMPSLPLLVNGTTYLSDSARIEVGFSRFNPGQDYHDIKDIIEVPNPFAVYYVWTVAALTLLSLAGFLYFVWRKKQSPAQRSGQAGTGRGPYEEALAALKELKGQRLAETGQLKAYYTRLNDIFRVFLLGRLRMASMVKTNDELILQLKQMGLPSEEFSRLAQSLRMSDFVKFAKYQPAAADNDSNFDIIRQSVDLLNNTTT